MIVSWVDNSLTVGSDMTVAETKEGLMSRFDYEDCGELDGYVGFKITLIVDDVLKFTQPVILQRYADEFELPNCKCPTPAMARDCLTRYKAKDALGNIECTKFRSGVSKKMHVMHYSLPQIYNAVRYLSRHVSQPAPKYTKVILHCIKHCADRPNHGLILKLDKNGMGAETLCSPLVVGLTLIM